MTGRGSDNDLAEQLARRSAEVEVLRRIALDINATLDLDPIYDVVLRTMDECFGFRHSIILLLEDPHTLRVVASRGYDDQALGGTVAVGIGVIGMVAKRRRLMRVNHLRAQQAYFERIRSQMQEAGRAGELGNIVAVPGLPDADSQIAIPLTIKDKLIGVFSVESREPEPFSEHDESLVSIVASQAASAIQNALLYRAGEERRKELAVAHERLKQLNETLEERVRARTRELEQVNRDLRDPAQWLPSVPWRQALPTNSTPRWGRFIPTRMSNAARYASFGAFCATRPSRVNSGRSHAWIALSGSLTTSTR
jgi:adenylate cyclase